MQVIMSKKGHDEKMTMTIKRSSEFSGKNDVIYDE